MPRFPRVNQAKRSPAVGWCPSERIAHATLAFCLVALVAVASLNITDAYSKKTRTRAKRTTTRYIILHTTEGAGKGSLNKLQRYGEAHYMVDRDGKVYRIIEKHKIALHAGRSMWNGLRNLDHHALGIEIVGYHDKPITARQITATRELLRQLQNLYGVPDRNVIPHSMVAYGRPNRWHRRPHRGRKRCGMQFGDPSLRAKLGLTDKPAHDPDVRAGRLVNADPYLAKVLFSSQPVRNTDPGGDVISPSRSAWDIAREKYNTAEVTYVFPDGTRKRGDAITAWNRIPPGTRVIMGEDTTPQWSNVEKTIQVLGEDGATPYEIAGELHDSAECIYFFPNGRVRAGDTLTQAELAGMPKGTRMLVGYIDGGFLTANRRAYDVCGPKWNLPETIYRFPDGRIRSGDQMNEAKIPKRTQVFFQR